MTIKGWPDSRRPVEPIGGWGPGHPGVGNVSGLPNIARRLNRAHPIVQGLVGWWPLDEGQGTRARDLSIYGNHGTLTGMADPATATSGWGAGASQRELAFDGTNDYISVPHSASLAVVGALTLSFWLLLRDFSNYFIPIAKVPSGGTAYAGSYAVNMTVTAGGAEGLRGNGSSHGYFTGSSPNGVANVWRHIAMTDDRTTGNLYVDGVLYAGAASSGIAVADSGYALELGRRRDGYNVKGQMAHVRIYNRALSETAVKQLYADPWIGSIGGIT